MRRALRLFLGAIWLGGVGCSGGLLVDKGNAFPCQFDLGPATRDEACPQGWVCGVANACQKDKPEGLPEGLTPPRFDGRGQVLPSQTPTGVVGLGTSPRSLAQLAAFDGLGSWFFSGGLDFKVTDAGFLRAGLYEPGEGPGFAVLQTDDTHYTVLGPDGGMLLANAATPEMAPIVAFRSASAGAADGGAAVDLETYSAGIGNLVYSMDPVTFALTPVTVAGVPVLDLRRLDASRLGSSSGGLTWVYVLKEPFSLVGPKGVVPLGKTLLEGRVRLQHSADGSLWAVSYAGTDGKDRLAAFSARPENGYAFAPLMAPCVPCPGDGSGADGQVAALSPGSVQPLSIEVVCASQGGIASLPIPSAVQVLGGPVSPTDDTCTLGTFSPPFALGQVSTVGLGALTIDDSVGGFIAFGGRSGQLWAGPRMADALPTTLDQRPQGFGTVAITRKDAGTAVVLPLAFTDDYLAVDLDGRLGPELSSNGYVVIGAPSEQGFGGPPDGILPRAAIQGTEGWLLGSDGRLVHLELELQPGVTGKQPKVHSVVKFGPLLLGPTGAPAQAPFQGTVTRDGNGLLIAAGDSLYLYEEGTPTDRPDGLAPLGPQLTPQAGFPIRSLTVDRSGGTDSQVHGYAVTSNTLYEFELGGTPEHWSGHQIVLSGGEPVAVWMQDDASPYGRVGYRDGSLFTLPDGLPLAGPLLKPDGGADRVIDFANFGGWPLASTASGLYLATPADAGSRLLSWQHVTLQNGEEPWVGQGGKLQVTEDPDGGVRLMLFVDHGVAYEVGHAAR